MNKQELSGQPGLAGESNLEPEFRCPFFGTLCPSCVMELSPHICCLHDMSFGDCQSRQTSCPGSSYCPRFDQAKTTTILDNLVSRFDKQSHPRFSNVAKGFKDHYLPEVRPIGSEAWNAIYLAKASGAQAIAVSLKGFFTHDLSPRKDLTSALRVGIHEFLAFDGDIVLTTDVPDVLCDHLMRRRDQFLRIIQGLAPDAVTTLDSYTYGNLPAVVSEIKMRQALLASLEMEEVTAAKVGLLLGATINQLAWSAQSMKNLGLHIVAVPCYELRRDGYDNEIRGRVELLRRFGLASLLLSCGPGLVRRRAVLGADYYSSYAWYSASSGANNPSRTRHRRLAIARQLASIHSSQATLLGGQN